MTNNYKLAHWTAHLFVIYAYFLLYAQFAFLDLLKASDEVQLLLPFMLLGASISALWIRQSKPKDPKLFLNYSFLAALIAAILPIFSSYWLIHLLCSLLIGLSVSTLTILTTAILFKFLRYYEIIFVSACSTALAYFFCNIPDLHYSSSVIKGLVTSFLCIAGLINISYINWKITRTPRQSIKTQEKAYYYLIGVLFLIILLIDSYSFSIIQNSERLMSYSWGNGLSLYQGFYHILGALVAYFLLKSKGVYYLLSLVMILFCISIVRIGGPGTWIFANLYAIGVSMYSTALISFPAHCNESYERRIEFTTDLYLLAGWVGSAIGIFLGQGLSVISYKLFVILSILFLVILCRVFLKRNVIEGKINSNEEMIQRSSIDTCL
ncbi:hypothetical protein MJH12_16170 [bacterium]|nr:hypothetical protein [bacterium]